MKRGVKMWVGAGLAGLAATGAAAAPPLEGVYKRRFDITMPGATPYKGEDILEIVRVGPDAFYVRVHTEHAPANSCDLWGVAKLARDALVFRRTVADTAAPPCNFTLQIKPGGMSPNDPADACRASTCGPRASWGSTLSVVFPFTARREIRYLERLKRSQEYLGALADFEGRKPPG